MKNIKKQIFFAGAFVVFSSYAALARADVPVCSKNASGVISDSSDCYANATQMQFPVYKVALCQAKPSAPTLSTPVDISKCMTLLSNPSGTPVTVRTGGMTTMPGQVTPLATLSGGKREGVTYSYAYIEAAPSTAVQATATFTSSKTGVAGGSGVMCWSTQATIYSFNPSGVDPTAGAKCGSSPSDVGLTNVLMNSLGTDKAYMSYTGTSNGVTTDTYLVDSSLRQAADTTGGSMGTVSKVISIQTLPITITQQSGGIKVSIQTSQGAWIAQRTNLWFQNGNATLVLNSCGQGRCN
jgi:hypothetical protein